MRVYIAGPMTGHENFNREMFHAHAAVLRNAGHEVLCPAEIEGDMDYAAAMRICISWLITCEAIYMLPGWHQSKGAMLEFHVATVLGLQVMGGF